MGKYPKKRATKIAHEQYLDFTRAVSFGGVIDYYYLLHINDQWWACRKGESHGSKGIEFEGDFYHQVVKVRYYTGKNGQRVLGYINKIDITHKTLYFYRFMFVKNPFEPSFFLTKLVRKKTSKKAGRPVGYHKDTYVPKPKKSHLKQPVVGPRIETPKTKKRRL